MTDEPPEITDYMLMAGARALREEWEMFFSGGFRRAALKIYLAMEAARKEVEQ